MDMPIAIITTCIASIVSVIGWLVVNCQGRKMRKEEAQRDIYKRLFEMTLRISNELTDFYLEIDNRSGELRRLFIESNANSGDKKKTVDKWYEIVTKMVGDTFHKSASIGNYMKFLEMGGANIGGDTMIYQGLKSVSIDTNKSLYNITGRWINYVNFTSMNENQLNNLTAETKKESECIMEFCGCLDDILIYLYNSYMAAPLKLKQRKLDYSQNRRYLTENGIIDKRIQ